MMLGDTVERCAYVCGSIDITLKQQSRGGAARASTCTRWQHFGNFVRTHSPRWA
jgi:hypothetical protein